MNTTSKYSGLFFMLMFLTFLGMAIGIYWGYELAFRKLQAELLYPRDVIYGQGETPGNYLAFIPQLALCLLISLFIMQRIFPKSVFCQELAANKNDFFTNRAKQRRLILTVFIVCIPLTVVGFFNYTYFTETRIVHHDLLWDTHSYSWEDVESINSRLYQPKRSTSTDLEYSFHIRNGTTLSVDRSVDTFSQFYPGLIRVIKSHPEITLNSTISASREMVSIMLSQEDADMAFRMAGFLDPQTPENPQQ